ncbi:DUF1488 domain-containing protein [Motilimonas eburnea]|uniref:DUF1488 domain-containing protein n=1 Tax=Motilimonas eburnea TaxID=1737488 RepID=UPI001E44DD40|nr:DUF1488 domain-containing protein [Motilimonas eburnea]MCE2572248.1 DUF1488 domain-containing protein [Motilimonas eburnea]
MNQSIQFPDQQEWNSENQVVEFPALNAGQLIPCQASLAWLQQHDPKVQNQADILALFELLRFDIEEQVEAMIQDEEFDQDGVIRF